jgi:hypothetical protein
MPQSKWKLAYEVKAPKGAPVIGDYRMETKLQTCESPRCKAPYPHYHLELMGGDGVALIPAPIQSRSFFEFVLARLGQSYQGSYVPEEVAGIRKALLRATARLPYDFTYEELNLLKDRKKWRQLTQHGYTFGV